MPIASGHFSVRTYWHAIWEDSALLATWDGEARRVNGLTSSSGSRASVDQDLSTRDHSRQLSNDQGEVTGENLSPSPLVPPPPPPPSSNCRSSSQSTEVEIQSTGVADWHMMCTASAPYQTQFFTSEGRLATVGTFSPTSASSPDVTFSSDEIRRGSDCSSTYSYASHYSAMTPTNWTPSNIMAVTRESLALSPLFPGPASSSHPSGHGMVSAPPCASFDTTSHSTRLRMLSSTATSWPPVLPSSPEHDVATASTLSTSTSAPALTNRVVLPSSTGPVPYGQGHCFSHPHLELSKLGDLALMECPSNITHTLPITSTTTTTPTTTTTGSTHQVYHGRVRNVSQDDMTLWCQDDPFPGGGV